jgi:hypothetical protein
MSTVNTASIQDNRSGSVSGFRSAAISIRTARPRTAAALGTVAGAVLGLAAGVAGILVAPNLALPVLLVMGVFFGVFNGVLLGVIATVGDERPA